MLSIQTKMGLSVPRGKGCKSQQGTASPGFSAVIGERCQAEKGIYWLPSQECTQEVLNNIQGRFQGHFPCYGNEPMAESLPLLYATG